MYSTCTFANQEVFFGRAESCCRQRRRRRHRTEIFRQLVEGGHEVVSLALQLPDPAAEPHPAQHHRAVDLGIWEDVTAVAKSILDELGRCDVFVHGAAVYTRAELVRGNSRLLAHVQAVNVESPLVLAQASRPTWGSRRSRARCCLHHEPSGLDRNDPRAGCRAWSLPHRSDMCRPRTDRDAARPDR